jgi:tungstate transport system substrate-binding protein
MKRNKLALPIVKIIFTCSIVLSILFNLTACNKESRESMESKKANEAMQKPLTLATTTSLNDSGLLDYLKPLFEKETSIPLKIIAQGTGQAIKTGESGDADVLFVHDKKSEEKFITDGFGVKRIEVMHNYFVIVGPKEDPAKIKSSNAGAADAFKLIAETKSKFVSRGDDSGTNKKEKAIWTLAGLTPSGDWYISAGKGMGDVLKMSSELSAYTLSDKSTYLSMKDKLQLDILLQNAPDMKNVYTLMAVNKEKHPSINSDGANKFIKWMTSDKTLNLIKVYGEEKYGEALFTVDFIK